MGKPLSGRLIAISVGDSRDLARLGYGPEHLDEAALRIVRSLLQLGCALAFAGRIRPGDFSHHFEELVQSESALEQDGDAQPKLLMYQPWPRDSEITAEVVARAVGIVRYFPIPLKLYSSHPVHPAIPNVRSPQIAWQTARAFTCMREAVARGGARGLDGIESPPSDGRIILGGQREDFSGAMPGVVEEALYHMEAGKPLYIIGGFGGGARLLAEALLSGTLPPELTLEHHLRASAKFRLMHDGFARYESVDALRSLFVRLERAIAAARHWSATSLDNGLSKPENRTLMCSEDLTEVLGLLRRGLIRAMRREAD